MTRNLLLALALCVLSIPAVAQLGGTTVFNVLNVPRSARISALGGNLMQIGDGDLSNGLYNPALLSSKQHGKLDLGYVNYFSDINFGSVGYAHHVDSIATFAAGIQYATFGDFNRTDELGQVIGNFTGGDYVFSLGGGYVVDSNWTIGGSAKFLYSQIDNFIGTGAAVDFGAYYERKEKLFTAAFLLRNAGFMLRQFREGNNEKLPFEMQIGVSKRLRHAPFRFTLTYENLQQWDLTFANPNRIIIIDPTTGEPTGRQKWEFGDKLMRHLVIGAELLFTENLNLRVGYNYRKRQELAISEKPGTVGLSWGFGFKLSKFQMSYGRNTYHLAGPSNHFTITTQFGDWKRKSDD